MSYQLFRLMARMDRMFACDDQSPADRNDWRELKRHIVGMKDALTLVHVTLREERERGIPQSAETARKLEEYTRRGIMLLNNRPPPTLKKCACKNVGSPREWLHLTPAE